MTDHYLGEAQTLTTLAEQNLLKLAELRGTLSPEQRLRWESIKEEFQRIRRTGGAEGDPVQKVTGALAGVDAQLRAIRDAVARAADDAQTRLHDSGDALQATLARLDEILTTWSASVLWQREHAAITPSTADASVSGGEVGVEVAHAVRDQAERFERSIAAHARTLEAALGSFVDALSRAMGAGAGRPSSPPVRVEVNLGVQSPSHFFRTLDGDDVLEHGGLFVATYGKAPPVGTVVSLRVTLPAGQAFEAQGVVTFLRPHSRDLPEGSAGYGVRFIDASERVRSLVANYLAVRPASFMDA